MICSTRRKIFVATAIAVFACPAAMYSQVAFSSIPQQNREAAKNLLASANAKYLSGTGLSTLMLIAAGGFTPASAQPGAAIPGPSASAADRSGIMVNDPAKDFLAFDISTQSETAVAAYGRNVIVAYNSSPGLAVSRSGQGYSLSRDSGASFTDMGVFPTRPTGFNFGDPGLVADRSGTFYVSNIAFDLALPPQFAYTIAIAKSIDGGITFGQPVYLTQTDPFGFMDKEFIAVDTSNAASRGNIYVTYTEFGLGPDAPIMFARSTDGGATFSVPVQISTPASINQGSEPVVGPNGELYVAWYQYDGPSGPGPRVAKSIDGGLTFSAPVKVASSLPPGFTGGSMFGGFRVNGFPRIDVNPVNGQIYLVYAANARFGDSGDIFFLRSADGASTWSTPMMLNTDGPGADQVFPDIAVNASGSIRVFWYDKRLDPHNLRISLFIVSSEDGGLTFSPNRSLTSTTFLPVVGFDPLVNPTYMGDYNDIKAGMSAAGRTSVMYAAWGDCRRIVTTPTGSRPDQDVFFTVVQ